MIGHSCNFSPYCFDELCTTHSSNDHTALTPIWPARGSSGREGEGRGGGAHGERMARNSPFAAQIDDTVFWFCFRCEEEAHPKARVGRVDPGSGSDVKVKIINYI